MQQVILHRMQGHGLMLLTESLKKMKVALSMIQKGLDNETIAELTELTQGEIEQLRRQ
ncbi:hypothetical protein P4S95_27760 [Aneurinibacillus aneurinilyticus]|uniref:hypothetical protein n=1 Tax=Aneurinibacillus aneurinilyticus TaxID=1391 RepID=UPI002E231993|nr:hypothetical protein [Aneurinibacillus aneurinilyticus]